MKSNKVVYILILLIVILLIVDKSSSLKNKIAVIAQNAKFKTITKNMQRKKLDNITYYYSNKKDDTYRSTIKEYIEEGEAKTSTILGQTASNPLNIIIFPTSQEFGKAFKVNPHESLAVTIFDSLYIPWDNIHPYVFVHEYTHYKIRSYCKANGMPTYDLPIWFQEGVAEYASSTLNKNKFKNPKVQNIQDFNKLDKLQEMVEAEYKGQGSYMQSYMAVKKIIELKGQNSIQEILINTKSMTFYNSFEKVVGLSIEDFQKLLG